MLYYYYYWGTRAFFVTKLFAIRGEIHHGISDCSSSRLFGRNRGKIESFPFPWTIVYFLRDAQKGKWTTNELEKLRRLADKHPQGSRQRIIKIHKAFNGFFETRWEIVTVRVFFVLLMFFSGKPSLESSLFPINIVRRTHAIDQSLVPGNTDFYYPNTYYESWIDSSSRRASPLPTSGQNRR